MTGEGSAFAALGLEPDADPAEIERAYRRLIKQHHPDRVGGDAERAAEINRAYAELRSLEGLRDPLELHEDETLRSSNLGIWIVIATALAVAAAAWFWLPGSPNAGSGDTAAPRLHIGEPAGREPMDGPLSEAVIDGSALQALQLSRTGDEMALAKMTAECHRELRSKPSLPQFDRCAAFDNAVVQLENRDPLRDQGPFAEIAVTGRLWSAAGALSQDSLAIDGRLDRIRSRVGQVLSHAAEGKN